MISVVVILANDNLSQNHELIVADRVAEENARNNIE
jgi:hypothetical protein